MGARRDAIADVVGASEAKIVFALDKSDLRELLLEDFSRSIAGGVIDDDDLKVQTRSLPINSRKAGAEIVQASPGNDDD